MAGAEQQQQQQAKQKKTLTMTPKTTMTSPLLPPKSPTDEAAARLHRPIMQSMPESRQQSFDEIYGPPENFLEIEVRIPRCPLLAGSTRL